jgi:hypothetical protein
MSRYWFHLSTDYTDYTDFVLYDRVKRSLRDQMNFVLNGSVSSDKDLQISNQKSAIDNPFTLPIRAFYRDRVFQRYRSS